MPDHASIYIAGIEDAEYKSEKIDCMDPRNMSLSDRTVWDNVYGYNFGCIKEMAYREPLVDVVDGQALNTSPCEILVLCL